VYTLEDFKSLQEKRRDQLCERIWSIHRDVTLLLTQASWTLLEDHELVEGEV
jgi:hypothetical protein